MNIFRLFILLVLILSLSCKDETEESLKVIMRIEQRDAIMKCSDFVKHIYFVEGIIIDSPTLRDTLYMLEPVNLPEQFNLHDLKVTVSGDIMDIPDYSSNSPYAKFYIREIQKRQDH